MRANRAADMAKAKSTPNNTRASRQGLLTPSRPRHDLFGSFATDSARVAGKPAAFIAVAALIVIWACTGPIFQFSEKWFLFINTAGTVVTMLVVFLIQNTQNRDTLALQLKLAELILVMEGAESKMALAEDLSHDDLEQLKDKLRKRTKDGA
jgi:low affinity Fe/Cu permease